MEERRQLPAKVTSGSLCTLLAVASPLSLYYLMLVEFWRYLWWIDPAFRLSAFDLALHSALSIAGWALFYLLLFVFPAWFFVTSRRVREQSHLALPFSPTRAALAFVTPIQQIALPAVVMRSLSFRAEQKLPPAKLMNAWWCSWLTLFTCGVHFFLLHICNLAFLRIDPHIAVFWLYGSASIFCALSLALVVRIEQGLQIHSTNDGSLQLSKDSLQNRNVVQ